MEFSLYIVFTAGILAAFNPCGVALLPSYIAYLIGTGKGNVSNKNAIAKGVGLGLSMTLGFLTVFTVIGFIIISIGNQIISLTPWLSLLVGIFITILGIGMLSGKQLSMRLPTFEVKQGKLSVYFYGVAYSIGSLGCTLPAFLMLISQSLMDKSIVDVLVKFLVYSIGMGIVVTVITTLSLLSKTYVNQFIKKYTGLIEKISAVVVVLSGVYLIYYWTIGNPGLF